MAASNRLMLVAAKPGLSIRPVARDSLLGLHTSFWQSSGETCASGLAAATRRDDPALHSWLVSELACTGLPIAATKQAVRNSAHFFPWICLRGHAE